jgi:hypothetical protein
MAGFLALHIEEPEVIDDITDQEAEDRFNNLFIVE